MQDLVPVIRLFIFERFINRSQNLVPVIRFLDDSLGHPNTDTIYPVIIRIHLQSEMTHY